jgi:hypothetical protein
VELDRLRESPRAGTLLTHLPIPTHDHAESPAADYLVPEAGIVEKLLRHIEPLAFHLWDSVGLAAAASCKQGKKQRRHDHGRISHVCYRIANVL